MKRLREMLSLNARMSTAQVPPQLSGADELLDIPLDEDCLQRLLSNDLAEDSCTKLKVRFGLPMGDLLLCMHS